MHDTSVEIFEFKKEALAGGNEVVQEQMARGKDIMSILSEVELRYSLQCEIFYFSF